MTTVTHWIGRKAGRTLMHSARTAAALGRPLNTCVTINFWQLGSTWETVFEDFRRLRADWFVPWSDYSPKGHPQNGTPTWVYAHENESDLVHTHWMVHIHPANRARFAKKLEQRLCKYFGRKVLPEGTLLIENIYNAEGLKKYLAKNLRPVFAEKWNIESEEGGPIARRRADASRNLGPSIWHPRYLAYKQQRRRAGRQPSMSAQEVRQRSQVSAATATASAP